MRKFKLFYIYFNNKIVYFIKKFCKSRKYHYYGFIL